MRKLTDDQQKTWDVISQPLESEDERMERELTRVLIEEIRKEEDARILKEIRKLCK